jgi:hypothetical protein
VASRSERNHSSGDAEFTMNTETRRATVSDLFALLVAPVARTDVEIAELLGIGVVPLRDRMKNLRRRGILAGPTKESTGSVWQMYFPTVVEARLAARRSGLDPDTSVIPREPFWRPLMRAWKEAVRLAAISARRWLAPSG